MKTELIVFIAKMDTPLAENYITQNQARLMRYQDKRESTTFCIVVGIAKIISGYKLLFSSIVIIDKFVYNNINIVIVFGNLGDVIMSDINVLLEKAVNETVELRDGEVFLLRDLFKGYEWNRISRSNRLLLGTLFLNKISSEYLEIIASTKTSSGQQKYQIVRGNNHA